MSDTAMLGFSQTGTEREAYRSIYVTSKEAEVAFGAKLDLRPHRVHPLQPFVAGRNYKFLQFSSLAFAVLCLLMAAIFSSRPGHEVLRNQKIGAVDLPVELAIPLQADSNLTAISLRGDVNNSWVYLDIELTDPDDQPVFEAGRTIEVYSGRDSDGSWREGSSLTRIVFRSESTGSYTLTITAPEQGLWRGKGVGVVPDQPFSRLTVDVKSGLSSGKWLVFLGVAFGVLFGIQFGRKALHQKARWSGSDWVDED